MDVANKICIVGVTHYFGKAPKESVNSKYAHV